MQPHRCTIRACQSYFNYSDEKPTVKVKMKQPILIQDHVLLYRLRLWAYLDLPQVTSTLPLATIFAYTRSFSHEKHLAA